MATPAAARAVVLDTNVVLDLLLFQDGSTLPLRQALDAGTLRWLVLPVMREEFVRVLDYVHIARWREAHGVALPALLAAFDAGSTPCAPVPAGTVACSDPDDQPFLDLALAHGALLLSRDRAVLAVRHRLAACGVDVRQRLVTNSPDT